MEKCLDIGKTEVEKLRMNEKTEDKKQGSMKYLRC